MEILRISSAEIKIHQILVIFETTDKFFFKFCITLQCHKTQLLYTFFCWNFIYFQQRSLLKYNLVKFHVSSRKSELLHFDQFLLSKSYKFSPTNIQKSYLSWHWRVMQSSKKTWLVVSNMTWGIWWIFTLPLKILNISFRWALFSPKYSWFEL